MPPLSTRHGVTEAVGPYWLLMYHSCSPFPASVDPFPAGLSYQKEVDQAPLAPFQRLSVLNSSSKVIVAEAARLFGSIAILVVPRDNRQASSQGGWTAFY